MAIPVLNVGDKFPASNQNAIAAAINNQVLGNVVSSTVQVLATLGAKYATPAFVTFVLAVQTRVRVRSFVEVDLIGAAPMATRMQIGYNPGAAPDTTGAGGSIGATVTAVGFNFPRTYNTNALNDYQDAENFILLAAGTWSVFGLVGRVSGGGATDQIVQSNVLAEQIGFT